MLAMNYNGSNIQEFIANLDLIICRNSVLLSFIDKIQF